jgi:hypothetical protein
MGSDRIHRHPDSWDVGRLLTWGSSASAGRWFIQHINLSGVEHDHADHRHFDFDDPGESCDDDG